MGRNKKQSTKSADEKSVDKVVEPSSFGQKEAEKLAASYIPKGDSRFKTEIKNGEEVQVDKYDVIYITEDKNVFFKANEGEARSHAAKLKLKLFEVKWQD